MRHSLTWNAPRTRGKSSGTPFRDLRSLQASILVPMMLTVGSWILRCLASFLSICFWPIHKASTLFRELWTRQVLPLLGNTFHWKTYKKIMPWRRDLPVPEFQKRALESHVLPKEDLFGQEDDITFFENRVAGVEGPIWNCVCQRTLGEYFKYEAQMRVLDGNKTEYKSRSIVRNSTAEELTAFYLDDQRRRQWDGLLSKCESVEVGPMQNRCEVVRWIRSFPFPFLSDREYVIGRRIFKRGGVIYTVSKGVNHENVPITSSVVRMDVYYSMWSCRDIPCPWGSDQTACEVVLLHHEQFKIPEKLARFAAARGMWGFVKSMGPAMVSFVAEQRGTQVRETETGPVTSGSYSNAILASSRAVDMLEAPPGFEEGKPRVMKTVKRALLATAVGTGVLLVRKMHQKPKPS